MRVAFALNALLLATGAASQSLMVLEPDGVDDRIAEGRDYSVHELGNRWDMSDTGDLVSTENQDVTNVQFPTAGGTYRALTAADPRLWLVFPGVGKNSVRNFNGEMFPINSSLYRKVAVKARALSANANERLQFLFYPRQPQGTDPLSVVGKTQFALGRYASGDWQVVVLDLIDDAGTGPQWTDSSQFSGLRFDPTGNSGVDVEIDWIRLVAPDSVDNPSQYLTAWTSNGLDGQTVDIFAVDVDGAEIELASGVSATADGALLDTSVLPPGEFTLRLIASGGLSADSPGDLTVNETPNLVFLEPDIRGDLDNSYAAVIANNPWGPYDPADIAPETTNVKDESFSEPDGAYCAVAVNSDPQIVQNTPQAIDTSTYRMLSFDYELEGPRDVGGGSVARFIWRIDSTFYTTEDIIIQAGRNQYSLGDLGTVPLEPGGDPPTFFWSQEADGFRFDPHEFSTGLDNRRLTLYSINLAPVDAASPAFLFTWSEVDADADASSVQLWLDADRQPGNGNEIQIADSITPTGGANSFDWQANVDLGQYHVYAVISDDLNEVTRYAGGPLNVTEKIDEGLVFANGFE